MYVVIQRFCSQLYLCTVLFADQNLIGEKFFSFLGQFLLQLFYYYDVQLFLSCQDLSGAKFGEINLSKDAGDLDKSVELD